MVEEIKNWLNSGQDYADGVALYEKYGSSGVRKRMFASGPSSFNREKLLESLQELVPAEPEPKTAKAPSPRKSAPEHSPKPKENIPADPKLLEQIMAQLRPLFDERTLAHSQLDSTRITDADRLQLALRIHELSAQLKKLQQLRAHVLEHGSLPEGKGKPEVDESDLTSLIQRRNNLRSTRSKLRKNPERAAELEATEKEIQRLTTLIKK
ncbi:hypothetical protein [Pontibacter beigongshangensis]|uniref:hypothetical protein n=1 Tax=Pontibacter beigongshangensis TaxID=2574733 RepID=UPI00164F7C1D|nr:hypothetical protein [Pontibacter beigongshangensis]